MAAKKRSTSKTRFTPLEMDDICHRVDKARAVAQLLYESHSPDATTAGVILDQLDEASLLLSGEEVRNG